MSYKYSFANKLLDVYTVYSGRKAEKCHQNTDQNRKEYRVHSNFIYLKKKFLSWKIYYLLRVYKQTSINIVFPTLHRFDVKMQE